MMKGFQIWEVRLGGGWLLLWAQWHQRATVLAESTASQFPRSVEILPLFSQCPGELCAGATPSLQAACWQKQPPASGVLRYEQCSDVLSKIRKQVACSLCSFVIWSCIFVLSFFFFFCLIVCFVCLLLFLLCRYLFLVRFGFGFSFVCAGGPAEGGSAPSTLCWARGRPGWATLNRAPLPLRQGSPRPQLSGLGCRGLAQASARARPLLHRGYGTHQECYSIPTSAVKECRAAARRTEIKPPIPSYAWRKSLPKRVWSPASPTCTFASRSKICRFSQPEEWAEGFSTADLILQALRGIFIC